MNMEQTSQPSVLEQATRQAAEHAAREVAKQALVKVGAVLGAKAGAVVAVVLAVIALVILVIVLIISVAGAAFQSSTAVWPVPIATDSAGAYTASGWAISSRFGWRDDPSGGEAEFHDGIDLANPQGQCPFGYHCAAPAMFDGQVQYVGWDMAASGDPSRTAGGELVILRNGDDDHETLYAHLEPYRLYVRLEGKINDSYDRDAYQRYQDYQTIGQGELKPDRSNGGIEMTCQNEMPNFIPTRTGGGSVVFVYDRPASCTTTVVWGTRGGTWKGWIADDPRHIPDDTSRASLSWQTQIDPGKRAKDVALRFRAHLVPPDPPPSPTAVPSPVEAVREPPVQPRLSVAMPGRGMLWSGQGAVAAHFSNRDGGVHPAATPGAAARDGKPRLCEQLPSGWVRCQWCSLRFRPSRSALRSVLIPGSWRPRPTRYTPIAKTLIRSSFHLRRCLPRTLRRRPVLERPHRTQHPAHRGCRSQRSGSKGRWHRNFRHPCRWGRKGRYHRRRRFRPCRSRHPTGYGYRQEAQRPGR
jgi:hypothetical protein